MEPATTDEVLREILVELRAIRVLLTPTVNWIGGAPPQGYTCGGCQAWVPPDTLHTCPIKITYAT